MNAISMIAILLIFGSQQLLALSCPPDVTTAIPGGPGSTLGPGGSIITTYKSEDLGSESVFISAGGRGGEEIDCVCSACSNPPTGSCGGLTKAQAFAYDVTWDAQGLDLGFSISVYDPVKPPISVLVTNGFINRRHVQIDKMQVNCMMVPEAGYVRINSAVPSAIAFREIVTKRIRCTLHHRVIVGTTIQTDRDEGSTIYSETKGNPPTDSSNVYHDTLARTPCPPQ